jgi:two-component system OmpR family response regulator/two-component system copper resistance phosphate regulon response regulator CusR
MSHQAMEILVIEDDPVIGKAIRQGITEAGHQCTWTKDSRSGFEKAISQQFDAIVLDLMLPGEHGLVVLKHLRNRGVRTPVLILTALGAIHDRVAGLKTGADDYLVKPFAMPELVARLDAICRRSAKPAAVMQVADFTVDLATRRVTKGNVEVALTPMEFQIVELLVRHAGQVVTGRMLCEGLWEADWEGTTNVLAVHLNRLRGKFQRLSGSPLIHTVRGRGYTFRAPQEESRPE